MENEKEKEDRRKNNKFLGERFKKVDAGQDHTPWIKEQDPSGRVFRHEIINGPRGGEHFYAADGAQRNAKAIPHVVKVWQGDECSRPPGDAEKYGNYNALKKQNAKEKNAQEKKE